MAFELTPFIKSTSDDSRFSDALDFFGDVAKGTAQGVVSGICGTAGDLIEGCTHVAKGEFGKAGRIAARRAASVVAGAVNAVESSVGLAASGADALLHDRDFLTEKNKARMTAVCQAAVYVAAGGALIDDSAPQGDGCALNGDACSLPGVENGVFVGDGYCVHQS